MPRYLLVEWILPESIIDFPVGTNLTDEFKENYWIPFSAVTIYMLFCFFGSKIMKERKAFNLISQLAVWNFILSLFSFLGFIGTAPRLFLQLYNGTMEHSFSKAFVESICVDTYEDDRNGTGSFIFWVLCFVLSKLPELIDTVFIVLRKKPLIFLHWYHHVTVLLYCWDAYAYRTPSGIYFVSMNYGVHSIMYFYFMMQALRITPKNFPTILITMAQISQMFVGTFIACSSMYYTWFRDDITCSNADHNLIAAACMYGSYLYLFVAFAVGRFLPKSKLKKDDNYKDELKKLDKKSN